MQSENAGVPTRFYRSQTAIWTVMPAGAEIRLCPFCLQVSNEQDRAKGGVRIRLKHYFARQKSGISQASSDSPI